MADDTQLAEATAPLSFAEFLDRMKDPAAADLVRSIKNFIRAFEDNKAGTERDGDLVQQFLAKSEGAFRQHPVWAAGPSEHQAQAIEGLEKYLMTKIYSQTFAISELDRERDQVLFLRMKALDFVRPVHLDLPESYAGLEAVTRAQEQLAKINNYKAPRDKLVCILNCSRIINGLLSANALNNKSSGGQGADDFLPVLIYIVIHANPPQLASNLEYIQRYRMRSRMVSESSYFFMQLYSAASFIETINANTLTIDPEEFRTRMKQAGLPDMQLMSDGTPGGLDLEQSPFHAGSLIADPNPEPSPSLPTGLEARVEKAPAAVAGLKGSPMRSKSADVKPASPALSMRSLAEMEEAGYAHLLKLEASGALQKRHPFIYANASELRVGDVQPLLAAYKRIVLRYESLSLLLAHEMPAFEEKRAKDSKFNAFWPGSVGGSTDSQETLPEGLRDQPPESMRPPAVDGPNPFATGGFGRDGFAGSSIASLAKNVPDSALVSLRRKAPASSNQSPVQAILGQGLLGSPLQSGKPSPIAVSLETLIHGHKRQLSEPLPSTVMRQPDSLPPQPQGKVGLAQSSHPGLSLAISEVEKASLLQPVEAIAGAAGPLDDRQQAGAAAEIGFQKCPVPALFEDRSRSGQSENAAPRASESHDESAKPLPEPDPQNDGQIPSSETTPFSPEKQEAGTKQQNEASHHTEADFEFSPFASLAQSQENTSPSLPYTADDSGHQSTQNRNLEQSESLI